jgi:hypothetical protein
VLGLTGPAAALAPAASAQDPGLAAGIRQVDEGDFEGAVATLEPVPPPVGQRRCDAAQACLYLGIARLALDEKTPRARFVGPPADVLRLSPTASRPRSSRRSRSARRRAAVAPRRQGQEKAEGRGRDRPEGPAGAAAAAVRRISRGGPGDTNRRRGVAFTGARFGTPCSSARTGRRTPLLAIDLNAQNGGGRDV